VKGERPLPGSKSQDDTLNYANILWKVIAVRYRVAMENEYLATQNGCILVYVTSSRNERIFRRNMWQTSNYTVADDVDPD
jgi:hypothetical protein